MSSYYVKIKIKATGEVMEATALDDYYGRHQYGYLPKDYINDDGSEKRAYRADEIEEVPLTQSNLRVADPSTDSEGGAS